MSFRRLLFSLAVAACLSAVACPNLGSAAPTPMPSGMHMKSMKPTPKPAMKSKKMMMKSKSVQMVRPGGMGNNGSAPSHI